MATATPSSTFTAAGEHIGSWGGPGDGPGAFTTPHAVWIDRQDRVLVADRENNRVQLFDRAGAFLGEWRDLYHPMDIYETADGSILVTDQVPRLSRFAPDGRLTGRGRPALNAPTASGATGGQHLPRRDDPSRITKLVPPPVGGGTGAGWLRSRRACGGRSPGAVDMRDHAARASSALPPDGVRIAMLVEVERRIVLHEKFHADRRSCAGGP